MRTSAYAVRFLIMLPVWMTACSSDKGDLDPCASTHISLSASITSAGEGQDNGSITVSASGSEGFTYSINGSDFQSSATFGGLAAGNYTIRVRDRNNCSEQRIVTVDELSGTPVSYAAQIRPIIENVCWNCHQQASQQGFPYADLSTDAKVKENATRINTEVQAGRMPKGGSLSAAEKTAIAAWVAAGAPIDN